MSFQYLRKIIGVILNRSGTAWRRLQSHRVRLLCQLQSVDCSVSIHPSVHIDSTARIKITDGGGLRIGPRSTVSNGVRIVARGGSIEIGADVFIGPGVIIVAQERIEIGPGCLIAEYVTIRDQDHNLRYETGEQAGRFVVSPVELQSGCWVGAKATILRGSNLGHGTTAAAGAVVTGKVFPPHSVIAGVPAKIIRARSESAS